ELGSVLRLGMGAGMVGSLARYARALTRHRTGHSRPTESAIPTGILGEVLLMVVFGEVKWWSFDDFGSDLGIASRCQRRCVRGARSLGLPPLLGAEDVDPRAVLGAQIVALAHALSRIV